MNKTREEFEQLASINLKKAVTKAKKIRQRLRQLELEVADKQKKINNYQQVFANLQDQLIKIQSIIYSKGST